MSWFVKVLVVLLVSFMLCPLYAGEGEADLSDPAEMLLAVNDNGTRYSWQLEYGKARGMVIRFLTETSAEKALEAARAQFCLCPTGELSIGAAVESVKEALVAADGDDVRAKAFEVYARVGPKGADGLAGTPDDLENPLATVALAVLAKDAAFYEALDKTIDARAEMAGTGEEWKARWYETEKIFARLNGGAFDDAVEMAVPLLAEALKYPAANVDDDWELQRNQDILDRIDAALGAAYRAKTGTVAGLAGFLKECRDYVRYGAAGADRWMGTDDDLEPPL